MSWGEDIGDLAMDAIAGLFERDDQGRFPDLRRFFDGQVDADQSDRAVVEDLRRLVQSTVTDWLFEAYRAADRSLSNQLRALKRAVSQREDVHLRRRGTVQWLEVIDGSDASERDGPEGWGSRRSGRPMPLETLEAHLTGEVADAGSTVDLLGKAIDTLLAHPDYESAYPLTRIAQAMRATLPAKSRKRRLPIHRSNRSNSPILSDLRI